MSNIIENLKIIFLLVKKDLKESLKNRTALMIIMLPLFASLMFSLVSSEQLVRNFELAVSGQETQELISFINDNFQNFKIEEYANIEAGKTDTASGNIDAALNYNPEAADIEDRYQIYLDSRDTVNFFILRENISQILSSYHNLDSGPQFYFQPAADFTASSSILPVWLTVTITMIGLMLISASLSEEKDNKTLSALLVSRVNIYQVIAAKTLFAWILTLITSVLMGALNGVLAVGFDRLLLAFTIISIAAFVFSGLGLIISLFSSSQSSSRSISTVIYFPIIFPALVADVSPLTQKLALFFPTHYLYQALDKVLVYQGGNSSLSLELSFLLLFAIIFYLIILIYIRKADSIVE
ncbi:ABC-2 type transport system permease protein [Halanaerobium saccharolyticum]|uniref:ABC-2 type transport system permease protein n=1 Tax=Halanaerobium saccharolyticum TaxID=43595 RepID=A0A4V6Q843_9FIRM|nr:ABC transporter permease [Halanaerobium saccharolyticum]RAK08965.1 ABC-2 type transport system permease protein [Halanaerobium saccharolyticum]TDW02641.1 ABC-2 type transport system permease protein [Halanaerobium saccharolyticum]TDX60728.1 ABC-2 type transport system permease protein [Halanaerobium saccharolyticum]